MITGAFNKPMTYNEAVSIVTEAMFSDEKNSEDYEKDFEEWLLTGQKIHSMCGG